MFKLESVIIPATEHNDCIWDINNSSHLNLNLGLQIHKNFLRDCSVEAIPNGNLFT